jgi:predicted transposase/invertase (TIGR01784 family)
MTSTKTPLDSPWKDILEAYFPDFMEFFFPVAHTQIDWSRGFEFMDGELQQLTKEAETGRLYTDKLAKVYLLDGSEQFVLCHIEVQSQSEDDFGDRVFTYFARIRDKFGRRVASFAVLGDTNKGWKPHSHQEELFGCRLQFDFPMVKLLEYGQRRSELEASVNPFAHVVLAHLAAQSTRRNNKRRRQEKFVLTLRLYEKGYDRQDVINIFKFLDWVMTLPDDLEAEFQKDLTAYEGEKKMPYITSVERMGVERGRQEGLQEGRQEGYREMVLSLLEAKIGGLPIDVQSRVEALSPELLRELGKALLGWGSIDDLTAWLDHASTSDS